MRKCKSSDSRWKNKEKLMHEHKPRIVRGMNDDGDESTGRKICEGVATRTRTDTASAISSGAEEGTEELPLLR